MADRKLRVRDKDAPFWSHPGVTSIQVLPTSSMFSPEPMDREAHR